jgi:hypothetical protein
MAIRTSGLPPRVSQRVAAIQTGPAATANPCQRSNMKRPTASLGGAASGRNAEMSQPTL